MKGEKEIIGKRILLVFWYIFLFVFFVGGTIVICWEYAKERAFIRQMMEHKTEIKP